MKELRQFERFVLNAPAKLYLHNKMRDASYITSIAHDISSGGAFLTIGDSDLTEASDLMVEIILTIDALKKIYGYPNEVKLTSKASIIRRTNNGIGVCFKSKPVVNSNTFR